MEILYRCIKKHIGVTVGKAYKAVIDTPFGIGYIIDNDGQKRRIGDLLNLYKIKRYTPRKKKIKLHPAITHINCSPDIDNKTIRAINKMVELAVKMKSK